MSGLDQDKLVNQAKEDWDWEEMEEEDGGLLHTHTQNKVQEISSQPVTCVRVTCSEMTMTTLALIDLTTWVKLSPSQHQQSSS